MADEKETFIAKAVGIVAALVASWAAQQLINQVWTRALGHRPPKPEDEGDVRFREIAVAAVVTGAVVSLARVLGTRGAAKLVR